MQESYSITSKPNRKYKDSLFCMIFGGKDDRCARWRMDLYNALSGTNHTDPNDFEVTTIENVIYINTKNDVSFLVDSQMTLFEHQSTVNPNMPLRGLLYFSQLYQKFISKDDKDLFGELVELPAPKYVVFYNGRTDLPEESKLYLSTAFKDFKDKGDFEWTATIKNINLDYNKTLQKKCKPLYDYVRYVDRIKTNQDERNMSLVDAVDEAVDWAIKEDFLEGYFREAKAEVRAVCLTEFDQELYDRNRRREGEKAGFEKGRIEGKDEKAKEAAKNLLKMNALSVEQIAQAEGLSIDEVQKLALEITAETQNV